MLFYCLQSSKRDVLACVPSLFLCVSLTLSPLLCYERWEVPYVNFFEGARSTCNLNLMVVQIALLDGNINLLFVHKYLMA